MHSLHKGLLARGVEVHVLADIRQVIHGYQKFEGIPIWGVPFPVLTSCPLSPGNIEFWLVWRTIRRVVLERIPRPDLIQVTTFRQPAMVGYWLAKVLDVPWIVRLASSGSYNDLTFSLGNWLSRWQLPRMVRDVSRIIALDKNTCDQAIAHGAVPDKVKIIQSGLVFRRFPSGDGRHFGKHPLPILFLGRLSKEKYVNSLLEAFQRGCDLYNRKWMLMIAGNGEFKNVLEDYASRLDISDRCEFLGAVTSPEDVLEKAGCFVNPSEGEGLPNAVLEAAAYGLPLILSDIPIHREIAEAVGMSDYLFPVGDSTILADRLNRFMNLNSAEKELLSRHCASFGRGFTPEIRDQAYYELYCQLVKNPPLERGDLV